MNESLRIFYIDTVLSYSNSFEKFYPLKCTVKVLGRYYSRRGQITEKCEWDKNYFWEVNAAVLDVILMTRIQGSKYIISCGLTQLR